jgi:hypothetical protein
MEQHDPENGDAVFVMFEQGGVSDIRSDGTAVGERFEQLFHLRDQTSVVLLHPVDPGCLARPEFAVSSMGVQTVEIDGFNSRVGFAFWGV